MYHRVLRRFLAVATCLVLALTALAFAPASAQTSGQTNRWGPNPTAQALRAAGPFEVLSITIADADTPGFGAATIYYPNETSPRTFGAVVALPGFTASRSSTAWIAERVASHGFVVLNANTNTTIDFPAARGTQMLAALDYLRNASPVAAQLDPNRVGVMGHSMGGGGALEAIASDPAIAAAVPLTPWNTDKTWDQVTVPTLILGAENDIVAGVGAHAIPFYNSMVLNERAYVEVNDGSHSVPTGEQNEIVSQYTVAWFKRYVDNDTRYVQFICPGPQGDALISSYQSSCSSDLGDPAGDANCDGIVSAADAQTILDFAAGLSGAVEACDAFAAGVVATTPADVDGYGVIDALDALVIARCLAGAGTTIDC